MKRVYIFCRHTVSTAHPNGVRLLNIGLILKELGYQVTLFGSEEGQRDRSFDYKGMSCHIWCHKPGSGFRNFQKREQERCDYICRVFAQQPLPDLVITALPNCEGQRYLMKLSKAKGFCLVHSVCEWFDKAGFGGVSGIVKFLDNRYGLCCQIPQIGNVIVISTLLECYYRKRDCRTLLLPTLIDPQEYQGLTRTENEKLVIAYAGSPAKKDYITNAIRAVSLLSPEEQAQLELHLYGAEAEQLSTLGIDGAFLKKHQQCIICHGRIPYEQVKERIAQSDFTVLLRPNKRYANAGFPTKVGESMACGTPVIANLTSDLGSYILDGNTGLICEDESAESCARAYRRALRLTGAEKAAMRMAAAEMAKTGFANGCYVEKTAAFLEIIESRNRHEK